MADEKIKELFGRLRSILKELEAEMLEDEEDDDLEDEEEDEEDSDSDDEDELG